MLAKLNTPSEIADAENLVCRSGLSFEREFDALFGAYEQGRLVAVGARAGNILKMLAIEPAHQGGPLLGEIATALIASGIESGFEPMFVFTKPELVTSFEALNFTLLVVQGRVALLEFGKGLAHWLDSKRDLHREGTNGAVVVNCNPFSRGHRYLIESSARQVDNLYVFVVCEDRSVFPFEARYRLVGEGTRDIANVLLLDTSHYQISSATFPTYFLKRDDSVARIQMELDLTLFATRIAPFFGISHRFVGSEPHCALTAGYNETMKRILPGYGIELTEVPRVETSTGVISASRVRDMIARNDWTLLDDYLPPTTVAYLASDEAAPVRRQLQQRNVRGSQ